MTALLALLAAALAFALYLLASTRARLGAVAEELDRTRQQLQRSQTELALVAAAHAAVEAQLRANEDRHEKLQQTFAALSKDALDANSAHLVQLAEQVLARGQEASRGDLEKRAQAVAELVRPVQES